MKLYAQRFLIIVILSSMHLQHYAQTLYHIPHLDETRIIARKVHFDRKYKRNMYIRYGGLTLLAAWVGYLGYNRMTRSAQEVALPRIPADSTMADMMQRMGVMQQDIESLQKNVALLKGNTWLAWGGDVMHHVVWGIELTTLCKIGIAIATVPTLTRFFESLVDLDAVWYELRSQTDYIKIITAQTRRFMAEQEDTPDDRVYVRRVTQNTMILLKRQIEALIGFVHHKQGEYQDSSAQIAHQVEDQIYLITLAWNSFADSITQLLNSDRSLEDFGIAIIERTQQFGQDYKGVKEQLKALEDRLYEETSDNA